VISEVLFDKASHALQINTYYFFLMFYWFLLGLLELIHLDASINEQIPLSIMVKLK